jgi:hypothetical protein
VTSTAYAPHSLTYREAMELSLPEMDVDGIKVTVKEITEEQANATSLRAILDGGRGRINAGKLTTVYIDGRLWMSDTPDEKRDHSHVFYRAQRIPNARVVINGLGAGMILGALLKLDNVAHIDVVEIDERIIKHIAPHYDDPRVTIHQGDALAMKWPVGTTWDMAWHDIWLNMSGDNLPEMHKLHRKYGRRTQWQASWGREHIEAQQRRGGYGW